MRNTFLVQRLDKKPKSAQHALISRVFGGGMIGMPEKGWDALQSVCDLHYMGAAEFEFGVIPGCLSKLVEDHDKLITFPLILKRANIKPNWEWEHKQRMRRHAEIKEAKDAGKKPPRAKKILPASENDVTVYVICRKDDMVAVGERIRELALDKHEMKRGSGFTQALDPASDYDKEAIGWLELDNGFMFFTGYEEYCGMAELFGVKPEEKANEPKTQEDHKANTRKSRKENVSNIPG